MTNIYFRILVIRVLTYANDKRTMKKLIRELLKGDKQAAARLISIVENDGDEARDVLRGIKPFTGKAHIVGITGAPGSGKSTIINSLTGLLRAKKKERSE